MICILVEDMKDSGRGLMPFEPRTHQALANLDTVTVNSRTLALQAHGHEDGPFLGQLWIPSERGLVVLAVGTKKTGWKDKSGSSKD